MPVFSDFLIGEIFVFFMVFMRIGSALMIMPGFGEVFISTRARLLLALSISFVVTPMLREYIPTIPDNVGILFILITKEIITGVFIGLLVRTLTSALHTAATALATQSGLANAMIFDLTQSGQTTAVSNTLAFAGLVLLFAADLHHVMLAGIIDSYRLIPVNQLISTQDMAFTMASYLNKAFHMALKLASPFITISLVTNAGAGVLSRLMPNFQVFFVLMPLQIWVAFSVLFISLPSIMLWYLSYIEDGLDNLLVAL